MNTDGDEWDCRLQHKRKKQHILIMTDVIKEK